MRLFLFVKHTDKDQRYCLQLVSAKKLSKAWKAFSKHENQKIRQLKIFWSCEQIGLAEDEKVMGKIVIEHSVRMFNFSEKA